MKQTAVEWFQDQIITIVNGTCELSEIQIFEKAKEMEKDQIIDFAYVIADDLACGVFRDKEAMEERYNEFLMHNEEDDDIQ
jgi:hypothetical protein